MISTPVRRCGELAAAMPLYLAFVCDCVYALYTLFIGMEVNRELEHEDLLIYMIMNL